MNTSCRKRRSIIEKNENKLGMVVKEARIQAGLTQKEVAAKLGITTRHLMSIENDRYKPSYDLLYRLIRELSIHADRIFYPEMSHDRRVFEHASTLLRRCGDRELCVVTATLKALLREE